MSDLALRAMQTLDWRQRVFALYAEVRAAATPEAGHALWRAGRDELLLRHPASPVLPGAAFAGARVAPYDPAWRFEVPVRAAEPARFDFETGTDGVVPFERVGQVEIPDAGTLDVWRLMSYGGGLFIPLRDGSSGASGGSYGGGRYLIDTIKGAHLGSDAARGTLVIDFNFAYNPSCAYDPAWACPLAPAGNVLPVPVPVGELYG